MSHAFHSIYSHGYVRACVCVPRLKVADPLYNAEQTLALARRASGVNAAVALFPELGISAYSCDDLFQQDALLDGVENALGTIIRASEELTPVLVVGAPLRAEGMLFNCGVVIYRGTVLGVVPKSYLPNYREFYERRQFTPGRGAPLHSMHLGEREVPFGSDLVFVARNVEGFRLHVEVCEDLWTPIPPSSYAAMAGATILANLSASNITVGKAEYRRDLVAAQSGKCIAAYLYSAAGPGESTTDLAWDGHALIYENDERLAESDRFANHEQIIAADVDLERLLQDRMRMTTFADCRAEHRDAVAAIRRIPFEFEVPTGPVLLLRDVQRFPFVPSDPAVLDQRCYEAYNIQVHGLLKRLSATGIQKVVIGVSGGLDSTQALIVAARTMDRLGLPRTNILGYTMPGFATSRTTRSNAHALMEALGITAREIDIRPSSRQMLEDIGHPYAEGEAVYDVTFENVQAGERTSHLFRLANHHDALVLGTGDLSEIALGWATYGVGDQMSHYNVNGGVPKTLIQHLIRWVADRELVGTEAVPVLRGILDTEISPELVPAKDGKIQSTEGTVGPYALNDFFLFYVTRFGLKPSKVAYLCHEAWKDASRGDWPAGTPEDEKIEYDLATIKHWLRKFLVRFFQTSQFKRSALPNGPKVVTGGSLSPRGDWRAPSDSTARVWLDELEANVPDA